MIVNVQVFRLYNFSSQMMAVILAVIAALAVLKVGALGKQM